LLQVRQRASMSFGLWNRSCFWSTFRPMFCFNLLLGAWSVLNIKMMINVMFWSLTLRFWPVSLLLSCFIKLKIPSYVILKGFLELLNMVNLMSFWIIRNDKNEHLNADDALYLPEARSLMFLSSVFWLTAHLWRIEANLLTPWRTSLETFFSNSTIVVLDV